MKKLLLRMLMVLMFFVYIPNVFAETLTIDQIVEEMKKGLDEESKKEIKIEGNKIIIPFETLDESDELVGVDGLSEEEIAKLKEFIKTITLTYENGVLSYENGYDYENAELELLFSIRDIAMIETIKPLLKLKNINEDELEACVKNPDSSYQNCGVELKEKAYEYKESSSEISGSYVEVLKIDFSIIGSQVNNNNNNLQNVDDTSSSSVTAVDKTETSNEEIPENPSTGVSIPLVSLFLLLIGSISVFIISKKKEKIFKL